jgi:hypothetical protein
VLAITVGACSDDDDAGGEESSTSTTEAPATTTTQPPGMDPAAVEPYVEELLARLDDVTTRIGRNPAVVLEPGDLLDELTEIQAPGEALDARLRTYEEQAANGLHLEPLDSEQGRTTTLTGDLSSVDENTVEGAVCVLNTYRLLNASGELVEVKDRLAHPGQVTAVRTDGVWMIQRVDVYADAVCEHGGEA